MVTMLQIVPKVFMLNNEQVSLILTVSYARFFSMVKARGYSDCFLLYQSNQWMPKR